MKDIQTGMTRATEPFTGLDDRKVKKIDGAQPNCPWLDTQGEWKGTQEDTDDLKMGNI